MRLLFVTAVFPKDFNQSVYGIFQRMRMWLDAIKSSGYELDILFLPPHDTEVGEDASLNLSQDLLNHWAINAHVSLCTREPQSINDSQSPFKTFFKAINGKSKHPFFAPYSGKRQKLAFELCMKRSPDIIFFQKIYPMGAATQSLLEGKQVFLDLDDVEHLRYAREIGQPPYWKSKKLLYLEIPALWRNERAAVLQSENAFVCSEIDRKYLQRVMRVKNVETVPNTTRWVEDSPLSEEQNVLFVGNGSYGPNKVAAECLIEEIWPRLKKTCPSARLMIVGLGWEKSPFFQNPPEGIEFIGFVPELGDVYSKARVMCCPIRSGSGTRIKILEAAGYGVPVVSTSIGAEGLDFGPNTEILLRDDACGLAEACSELLLDYKQASNIGVAGRERVRALYGRDAVIDKIRNLISCS